jgi:hypothetical protein
LACHRQCSAGDKDTGDRDPCSDARRHGALSFGHNDWLSSLLAPNEDSMQEQSAPDPTCGQGYRLPSRGVTSFTHPSSP